MDEKVWVTREVDQGTSFYVRIRLGRADSVEVPELGNQNLVKNEPVAAPVDVKLGERYPLQIVVAEDNAANQRVLMVMLRLGGTFYRKW